MPSLIIYSVEHEATQRSYEERVDSDDWLYKAVVVRENGQDLRTASIADVADPVVCSELKMFVDQLRQTVIVCVAETDERRVVVRL